MLCQYNFMQNVLVDIILYDSVNVFLDGLHTGKNLSFVWSFQWKITLMTTFEHVCKQIRIMNANLNHEFKF